MSLFRLLRKPTRCDQHPLRGLRPWRGSQGWVIVMPARLARMLCRDLSGLDRGCQVVRSFFGWVGQGSVGQSARGVDLRFHQRVFVAKLASDAESLRATAIDGRDAHIGT